MGAVAIGACVGCLVWLDVVNWTSLETAPGNDWSDNHYGGFVAFYLLFGLIYSGYQMVVEWIVSSMSNDPSLVAQYAGFMRGWASFGMCVSFVMAAQRVPQWGQITFQLM
jgi:23S rRNA C2498 (ribose-2'-O)-methylase RlmM